MTTSTNPTYTAAQRRFWAPKGQRNYYQHAVARYRRPSDAAVLLS